jgi:hypothetical protein
MKCVFALVVAASVLNGVAAAQPAVPDAFIKARQALAAAATKSDKRAYGALLADNMTWVDRLGKVQGKAPIVASVGPSSASTDATPDIRAYDHAVVMFARRGTDTRYMQVWVEQGGGWKLVAHQGTPVSNTNVPRLPGADVAKSPVTLPPTSGTQADVVAIQKVRDAINTGNAKADPAPFTTNTTAQFGALGPSGLLSKQDRISAIKSSTPTAAPQPDRQTSTRVYGNVAVSIAVNGSGSTISTIVYVRENGSWKRAAIVNTPLAP